MTVLRRLWDWIKATARKAAEPVPDQTWEEADDDGRIW